MAVETCQISEGDALVFEALCDYNASNGRVTKCDYQNFGPYNWRFTIQSPNKADLVVEVLAGNSGSTNVPQGYYIDGPNGAGVQMVAL